MSFPKHRTSRGAISLESVPIIHHFSSTCQVSRMYRDRETNGVESGTKNIKEPLQDYPVKTHGILHLLDTVYVDPMQDWKDC